MGFLKLALFLSIATQFYSICLCNWCVCTEVIFISNNKEIVQRLHYHCLMSHVVTDHSEKMLKWLPIFFFFLVNYLQVFISGSGKLELTVNKIKLV